MVLSPILYRRVLLSFGLVFIFITFSVVNNNLITFSENYFEKKLENNIFENKVKKIVAYSLLKQIDIESQQYPCYGINITQFENNDNKYNENDDQKEVRWKKIHGTELHISSVNLDTRLHPYHYVRMVGVVKGSWNYTQNLFCQIFTSDGSYYVVKPTVTNIWYEKWDFNDSYSYYQPTLISCRTPEFTTGMRIALSTYACTSNNKNRPFLLQNSIKNSTEVRSYIRKFTICVKPLDFKEDITKHLIQWIEMNKILGAEKFEVYVLSVRNSVWKILNWYRTTYPTTFKVRQFQPLPMTETPDNERSNASALNRIWQKRRYEVLTYNDCFYKNLDSEFVIPLDIDEIIVPKTSYNWSELLQKYNECFLNYSSLAVRNYYFFQNRKNIKNRTNDIFFFRDVRRTKNGNPNGSNSKSFIVTNNTLTVFNHYALHPLQPGVSKCYFMPQEDVQLNHYKDDCESVILPECSMYMSSQKVEDDVMFKYKKEFMERYENVLSRIN